MKLILKEMQRKHTYRLFKNSEYSRMDYFLTIQLLFAAYSLKKNFLNTAFHTFKGV
jgi:hypothetical protein